MTGVGVGFSFSSLIWAATVYFEKSKATAVGLVTAGAGIGTLALPPLCRYLFDNFTYQETLLAMAAIVVQFIIPFMLIRPKSYWYVNRLYYNSIMS